MPKQVRPVMQKPWKNRKEHRDLNHLNHQPTGFQTGFSGHFMTQNHHFTRRFEKGDLYLLDGPHRMIYGLWHWIYRMSSRIYELSMNYQFINHHSCWWFKVQHWLSLDSIIFFTIKIIDPITVSWFVDAFMPWWNYVKIIIRFPAPCAYIYIYICEICLLHVYIHIFICIDYLYLFFFVHTTGQRTYSERSLMSWHWKKNWALFQQILSHLQSEVSNNRWTYQNAHGTCRKLTYTFYICYVYIYIYTLWFTHEQWGFSVFFL